MENSGVVVFEAVVVAHDSEEKLGVLRQIGGSSQQPAIAKFSLLYVKARIALDKELRTIANFHWSQPFVAAVGATRVKQALVGARELRIFEKSPGIKALLANSVKVLHIGLAAYSTGLFSDLKWTKSFLIKIYRKKIAA